MANGTSEIGLIEAAIGLIVATFGAVAGHQYTRLDSLRRDIDRQFGEVKHDRDLKHDENQAAIRLLAVNYEAKQQEILLQLVSKATLGDIRNSEDRVLSAINQRFVDRDSIHKGS